MTRSSPSADVLLREGAAPQPGVVDAGWGRRGAAARAWTEGRSPIRAASSASALAPLALVVLCWQHTSFAFVVLRKLFDQHAAEFRESPWRIVAEHGHDPLAVGKADRDDRVAGKTMREQTATVLNRQTASLCGSGSGLSDYGCHQLTAKPSHEPRQPGRRRRRRGPLRPSRSSGKRSEARASTGAGPGPRFHGTPFARPSRTRGQFS